jgi:predicted acyltransferase
MGVLQRIAICFLLGSLIVHYFNLKKSVIISILILAGYWWIMWYFGNAGDPYSLDDNTALKFDRLLIPDANLWRGFGIPFDPEGLLSTLPAIVNVIAGYAAGVFIQKSGNTMATVWKLALSGLILVVIAKFWDVYFPINKPIWTSSYVLYSTGWTSVLLSILILVVEIFHYKKWSYPFEAFGKNPLFIYVMSGVVISLLGVIWVDGDNLNSIIYENAFLSWLTPLNASLLFAVTYTFLMWLIGYWMDKHKIYIKV